MNFIVLANFKSHKTSSEVESWLQTVAPVAASVKDKVTLLLAPSTIHLPLASSFIQNSHSPIQLTAQDVSPFPPGAYTGAVNATQLREFAVSYCLIGHSERRRYFHETHAEISNKAKELLALGITPALCLSRQDIDPQFAALDDELQSRCLYCFEPPEDIGGTVTAPLDLIQDNLTKIKNYVSRPVLYGGSVNADNIASLLTLPLEGVLVATASQNPDHINRLMSQVAHAG